MKKNAFRLAWLLGALVLATTSVAFAAPGGKHASTSSISLATSSDRSEAPSYGDSVTFDVSTDATAQPFVHLQCFQNGTLVLEAWQAWFYTNQTFTLGGSPAWQSGAADCTAHLENWDSYSKNGRTRELASTTFHVEAA
jgi:hypothetical protein